MNFKHFRNKSASSLPPPYPTHTTRPFIGMRARLSQVWLNQYTVILIIIVVKLALFQNSLKYSLDSAEKHTMSSCRSAERMASAAASMPHYLAQTANKGVEKTMDASVDALITTLLLILTGVENLVIFALEMWIGTYVCLGTAAIEGTAGSAINATESAAKFINGTLDDIGDGIQDGLDGLSDVLNKVKGAADDVKDFFTGDKGNDGSADVNKIKIQVEALKDIHIPGAVNAKLESLRHELPDYKQVKNSSEELIREPFDMLKAKLNDTLQSEMQFDATHIQLPAEHHAKFCDTQPGIPEFYKSVHNNVGKATIILIIMLLAAAALACIPAAWREVRNWRWMKKCAEEQNRHAGDSASEKLQAIHDAQNHMVVHVQNVAANRFKTDDSQTLARWWVDYVSYRPALMVLLLALSGFLMVTLQYIVLLQVKHAMPEWQKSVDRVTTAFTTDMQSEAQHWVNSTNRAISDHENKINKNLLGWVRTATGSVNHTLTMFQNDMNKELKSTFKGTPLYKPISSVVYCVIGSKVDKAEQGLTWVHDHAHVKFPRVEDGYLATSSANNDTANFNPDKIGNETANMLGSALSTLIDAYEKTLVLELYISTVLFACWLVIALLGLVYCLMHRGDKSVTTPANKPSPPPQIQEPRFDSPENLTYPGFKPPSFLATDAPRTPQEPAFAYSRESELQIKDKHVPVQVEQSPPRKSVKGVADFF